MFLEKYEVSMTVNKLYKPFILKSFELCFYINVLQNREKMQILLESFKKHNYFPNLSIEHIKKL